MMLLLILTSLCYYQLSTLISIGLQECILLPYLYFSDAFFNESNQKETFVFLEKRRLDLEYPLAPMCHLLFPAFPCMWDTSYG